MKIAAPPNVQTSGSRLVPSLRYRDVEAAIDWLCDAFGFEVHDAVSGTDGIIRHAQLTFGNDMIILLPALPPGANGPEQQPEESGGAGAQSLYFVVDDAESHYLRAQAAGADILENGEYAFGGRGYSCRDPEGHVWHFGTYNPRQEGTADGVWIREFLYGNRAQSLAERLRERLNPPVLVAAVVAAVVAAATVGWMLLALSQTSANARERGLAFRAMLPPQAEDGGVRTLARADERTQTHAPAAESYSAARRSEEASERPGQPGTEAARLNGTAFASIEPQRTDDAAERAARQAAERTAEEALKQSPAAQRTAAQAFRQLRATRKAAAAARPSPVAAREAVTINSPEAREQQAARDRAAKEAAAKEAAAKAAAAKEAAAKEAAARQAAERAREARKAAAEAERVKMSAAQPAKAPARPAQEQNADPQGGWDCVPSPPSGQIECQQLGKKRTPAKAPAAAKPKLFPVEIAREPSAEQKPSPVQKQPQEQRRSQEQEASAQFWDCQPAAPDGQMVCRPIAGPGHRTNR